MNANYREHMTKLTHWRVYISGAMESLEFIASIPQENAMMTQEEITRKIMEDGVTIAGENKRTTIRGSAITVVTVEAATEFNCKHDDTLVL